MNQKPAGSDSRRSEQLKASLRLLLQEGNPGSLHRPETSLRGERRGCVHSSYRRDKSFGMTQDDLQQLMDFVCSEVDIVDEVMDRFADLRLIKRAWRILEQFSCPELLEALDTRLKGTWSHEEGMDLS